MKKTGYVKLEKNSSKKQVGKGIGSCFGCTPSRVHSITILIDDLLENKFEKFRKDFEQYQNNLEMINAVNHKGMTPLMIATDIGRLDIVKQLIAKGANVNAVNNEGNTPIMIAASKGFHLIVNALIAAGADVSAVVNTKNEEGNTLLMIAAEKGNLDTVETLIAARAVVNAKNKEGMTALMIASEKGNLDTVETLIAAGADVNAKNKEGNTSLMLAVEKGKVNIVRRLISAEDADVNAKNKEGMTPLIIAAEKGNLDIVKTLIAKGADVNAVNNKGMTPLIIAVKNKFTFIHQYLLDNGAELSYRTNDVGINSTLDEIENKIMLRCGHVYTQKYIDSLPVSDVITIAQNLCPIHKKEELRVQDIILEPERRPSRQRQQIRQNSQTASDDVVLELGGSHKITFVKDGKKHTRKVSVNKRGTKYVTYNKKEIPVSKLKQV